MRPWRAVSVNGTVGMDASMARCDFMSLDPGSYTWAWAWIQDLTQYDAHPADMHQTLGTLEHCNTVTL